MPLCLCTVVPLSRSVLIPLRRYAIAPLSRKPIEPLNPLTIGALAKVVFPIAPLRRGDFASFFIQLLPEISQIEFEFILLSGIKLVFFLFSLFQTLSYECLLY